MAAAGVVVCAWLVSTSDFARSAPGRLTRLSVSVSVLSPGVGSGPLVPSSAIVIVLTICVVPEVTGSSMRTAKVRVPPVPAARLPRVSVQGVPPADPSGHDQAVGRLVAASKVVSSGTVSLISTPVAS